MRLISPQLKQGGFTARFGKAFQVVEGNLVEVVKDKQGLVKDFVTLQKSLDNILKAQLLPETTDAKLSELRGTLTKNYDNFVSKHGYLNAKKNLKILGEDPNYGKVAAIEKYREESIAGTKTKKVSASKADIFISARQAHLLW